MNKVQDPALLRKIRKLMVESLDIAELEVICSDVGVDWGVITGSNKLTKAQGLIHHLNRRGELESLIKLLKEERPRENWPQLSSMPVKIVSANSIILDEPIKGFLRSLFHDHYQITVQKDFSSKSYVGSKVYEVLPEREINSAPDLPQLIKIATRSTIEKEWNAYREHIKNRWPSKARINGEPFFHSEGELASLSYQIVGDGIFKVEDLEEFLMTRELDLVTSFLESRFLHVLKMKSLLPSKNIFNVPISSCFDSILPSNLVAAEIDESVTFSKIINPSTIAKGSEYSIGEIVRVNGLVVTKVDSQKNVIDLNLPDFLHTNSDTISNSYSIRIYADNNSHHWNDFKFGQMIKQINVRILATRKSRLIEEVQKLRVAELEPLPNPISLYEKYLSQISNVKANHIHGDLNLRNVLIDPHALDFRLVDFSDARFDYVLHDIWRLETEIVTKLFSEVILEDHLLPELIIKFYERLHDFSFEHPQVNDPYPLNDRINRIFQIINLIRKFGKAGLYDQSKYREYYKGLALYLLGSLKYRSLANSQRAKKVALLSAAVICRLIENDKAIPQQPSTDKPSPDILHNLPQPDISELVGREDELEIITGRLKPYPLSQFAIVLIDGIGGIGKSALALEYAHRHIRDYWDLEFEERWNAIIWVSAKGQFLKSHGLESRPRSQTLKTLDDICRTVAITLEKEELLHQKHVSTYDLIRRELGKSRNLLIVDNLESVDDESLISFLREIPAPSKVLITSRKQVDVAYRIRLKEISFENVKRLIHIKEQAKEIIVGNKHQKELYDRIGGVPLAIIWSLSQLAMGFEMSSVIQKIDTPSNEIAQYCFESIVQNLTSDALKLLMTLSMFAVDGSREAIGGVAKLADSERDVGLVELERYSLVNRFAGRFDLLPLTKQFVIELRSRDPQMDAEISESFTNYFVDFSSQLGGKQGWRTYHILDPDLQNLQLVIEKLYQLGKHEELGKMIMDLGNFLHKRGLWSELIEYSEMAVELAEKYNNKTMMMKHLLFGLGWIKALRFSEYEEALDAIAHGRTLALELGDIESYAIALRYGGVIHRFLKNFELARDDLQKSLQEWKRQNNYHWQIKTLGSLGENEWLAGDYGQALHFYEEAQILINEHDEHEQEALNLRRISEVLYDLGDYLQAKAKVKEALPIFQNLGVDNATARSLIILGKINIKLDLVSEAKDQLKTAISLSQKIGDLKRANEAGKILSALSQG